MNYAVAPRINNPEWLVHLARPFPATAKRLREVAKKWGFDKRITDLLEGFPEDETFESGDDFLTRCEEIEFLAQEQAKMPMETLRSQQD